MFHIHEDNMSCHPLIVRNSPAPPSHHSSKETEVLSSSNCNIHRRCVSCLEVGIVKRKLRMY